VSDIRRGIRDRTRAVERLQWESGVGLGPWDSGHAIGAEEVRGRESMRDEELAGATRVSKRVGLRELHG
jgi:hypothetical protein